MSMRTADAPRVPLSAFWPATLVGVLLCLPARGQELFTCPVLPREGQAFEIIYRADGTSGPRTAAFTVRQRNGVLVARRSVALVEEAGALQGSLKLAVPKNGLLRATVLCGESTAETVVPVISAKREVNLIYYGMDSRLLEQGLVRWVTLATSCDPAAAAALRRRGAKPLRWNWGGNEGVPSAVEGSREGDGGSSPVHVELGT